MTTITLTHYRPVEGTKESWVAVIALDPVVEVRGGQRAAVLQHAVMEASQRAPGVECTIVEVEQDAVPVSEPDESVPAT
jgi:hypothetical protein